MSFVRRAFSQFNRWSERSIGFVIQKAGHRPRTFVEDPRLIDYHNSTSRVEIWYQAKLASTSCFQFDLGPRSMHPWVVGPRLGLRESDPLALKGVLDNYYSLVTPESAAEWLDIDAHAPGGWSDLPPHAATLPWSLLSPEAEAARQEEIHARENALFGLVGGIDEGAKSYGPISAERLDMETSRLWSLTQSISTHGLQTERPDYGLFGDFLFDGENSRILVRGGGHRATVAAAVGIESIPLRISTIVRRREVAIWPQVTTGVYDAGTALAVFDRLLAGRPPQTARDWIAVQEVDA